MKKLPSILSFSAVIGLVLLLVSAALGVSVPFARIASGIVEFSVVAGMLGFFLADYAAPPGVTKHSVERGLLSYVVDSADCTGCHICKGQTEHARRRPYHGLPSVRPSPNRSEER